MKQGELVDRLTYLIQFHVYAEAEEEDVRSVIDSLYERDGWTSRGGWIIVEEDEANAKDDRLAELEEANRVLREALIYAAETTNDKHTSRKAFEALSALTPSGEQPS